MEGLAEPLGLTDAEGLPDPLGDTEPEGLTDGETDELSAATANSASIIDPRQYWSGVASPEYPNLAFSALNPAVVHALPTIVDSCTLVNRSVITPAALGLINAGRWVDPSNILTCMSPAAVDACWSTVRISTALGTVDSAESSNRTSAYSVVTKVC